MDKNDVKACLRALISSTTISYNVMSLLADFKRTEGCDLPTFEFDNPVSFLQSLDDTFRLFGDPYNPEICLIESKKSAHITSLVERQRNNVKQKLPYLASRHKRIIIPCSNQNYNSSIMTQNTQWGCATQQNRISSDIRNEKVSNKEENSLRTFKPQKFDRKEEFDHSNHSPNTNVQKISLEPESKPTVPQCVIGSQTKETSKNVENSDSCYFEDISDNESLYSTGEDSSTRSSSCLLTSSSHGYVNDGMKNKLKQLIKNHPDGLWCCDLPQLFFKTYKFELDYREFGYTSLIRMLSELPDVFRCIRPGFDDWILFDASVPPTSKERKITELQIAGNIPCEIKKNLQKLLCFCCSNSFEIEVDEILALYKEMFGSSLNIGAFGCRSVRSFLSALEGNILTTFERNGKFFVSPLLPDDSITKWEEALPPITADNDIFYDLFPGDVVGPGESFIKLDLAEHIALGQLVEVCAAEVWSPAKFFLQLYKFKDLLNKLMDDLQNFYNVHLKKYKMPDATIRAEQVCVGLYSPEPESPEEWHRAKILKVINGKTVSVCFIDYGTVTRVKKSQLRFLHRNFYSFPIQAFEAKLAGISPLGADNRWSVPVSERFLDFLRVPILEAEMVEVDFKKSLMHVVLYDRIQKPAININRKLIIENLARSCATTNKSNSPCATEDCIKNYSQINSSEKKENVSFEFDEVSDLKACENEEENKNIKVKSPEFNNLNSSAQPPTHDIPLFEPNSLSSSKNTTQLCSHQHDNPTKSNVQPPGFEKTNLLVDFNQLQYYLLEQQQEEIRKKINLLAIELLATNLNLKEMAMTNPELALKLATHLAEYYINSLNCNSFCVVNPFNPLMTDANLLLSNTLQGQNTMFLPNCNQIVNTSPFQPGGKLVEVCNGLAGNCVENCGGRSQIQFDSNDQNQLKGCLEENFVKENNKEISVSNVEKLKNEETDTSFKIIKNNVKDFKDISKVEKISQTQEGDFVNSKNIQTSDSFVKEKRKDSVCEAEKTSQTQEINFEENVKANTSDRVKEKRKDIIHRAEKTSQTQENDLVSSKSVKKSNSDIVKEKRKDIPHQPQKQTLENDFSSKNVKKCDSDSVKEKRKDKKSEKTSQKQKTDNPTIPQDCNENTIVTDTVKNKNKKEAPSKENIVESTKPNNNADKLNDSPSISGVKSNEYIKSIKIGNNLLHLITIEGKKYFCADELILSFTVISSREIGDIILRAKRLEPDYRILKKKDDEKVIQAFQSCQLFDFLKKKKKKLVVYLLPVEKVLSYLQALGCYTDPFVNSFKDLM